MAQWCCRGISRRRVLPVLWLAAFGLISFMVILHTDIAFPPLRAELKNFDKPTLKKDRYLLESSDVSFHGLQTATVGNSDDFKKVKVAENRFHFKPRREAKVQGPVISATSGFPEATPVFKSRFVANNITHESNRLAKGFNKEVQAVQKLKYHSKAVLHDSHSLLHDSHSNLDNQQSEASRYFQHLTSRKPSTPKRYFKDAKGFQRYKKYLTAKEPSLPDQENAVIILTNHRSGSSFFGELFNQHPDAFYLFEPLFPMSNRSECNQNFDLKVELLAEFVRCRFPEWNKVYQDIPSSKQIKNYNMKMCLAKGICFRSHTKELCEDRHCPRTDDKSVQDCQNDCGTVNMGLAENECRKKKTVVAKLIRFCDILDLESMMKSIPPNIKVLHLLRDPRAIASSRHSLERKLNLRESLERTCRRQSHNLLTGANKTPEWLKGKYMAVRYEETALFPYKTAKSVYEFVGLDFPDSMKEWIAQNTAIDTFDTTNVSSRTDAPDETTVRVRRENPYSTKRNATATVQKWTKHLPYEKVLQVEEVCTEMMKMAGYTKVGSLEEYLDNTRRFFVEKIPILHEYSQG